MRRSYLGEVVPGPRCEKFLVEIANLGLGNLNELVRLVRRFREFFPVSAEHVKRDRLLQFRDHLRQAWIEPNPQMREWDIFYLRPLAWEWATPDVICTTISIASAKTGEVISAVELRPPILTPAEQSILHLLKNSARTRYCGNPDCFTPYFWAVKPNSKYCSFDCALPAKLAAKRKWWARSGKTWLERKGRRAKKRDHA